MTTLNSAARYRWTSRVKPSLKSASALNPLVSVPWITVLAQVMNGHDDIANRREAGNETVVNPKVEAGK